MESLFNRYSSAGAHGKASGRRRPAEAKKSPRSTKSWRQRLAGVRAALLGGLIDDKDINTSVLQTMVSGISSSLGLCNQNVGPHGKFSRSCPLLKYAEPQPFFLTNVAFCQMQYSPVDTLSLQSAEMFRSILQHVFLTFSADCQTWGFRQPGRVMLLLIARGCVSASFSNGKVPVKQTCGTLPGSSTVCHRNVR